MESIATSIAPYVLAALMVWFALGPLMRLTATACFLAAAGGLAIGDTPAAAGIAALGAGCALVSHLLFRARHGRWRTDRARHLAARLHRRPLQHGRRRPLR